MSALKKLGLTPIFVVLAFVTACSFLGVKKESTGGASAGQKSGDGSTPAKAIVIVPETTLKSRANLAINTTDNVRWFYMKLQSGKKYYFETFGNGDPDAYVYHKSQVKGDGTISGDAVVMNQDDGRQGNNARIVFSPSKTGEYYLKILLFAGRAWSGKLDYRIQ